MTDYEKAKRLAEAMGWEWVRLGTEYAWKKPDGRIVGIFNPFTDANDDYAVLEWAIKNLDADAYFNAMTKVVGSYCYLHEYRIGYFARAALKVIDNDKYNTSRYGPGHDID